MKEKLLQIYNEGQEQVKKGKIPVLVAVQRSGSRFQYAVGAELEPSGILELKYGELSDIHKTIEDKVSLAVEHPDRKRYYNEGYAEARTWQGGQGAVRRWRVESAEQAYYSRVFEFFKDRNSLENYITKYVKSKKLSRLGLVLEMCRRERPDIFKRIIGETTNQEDYENDNWGDNSVVVARFGKVEPVLL